MLELLPGDDVGDGADAPGQGPVARGGQWPRGLRRAAMAALGLKWARQ